MLSVTDLIVHTQSITSEHPNLPQKAGRASTKLLAATPVGDIPAFTGKTIRISRRGRRPHNITVRVVMNPVPDVQRYVRIILNMSKHDGAIPELP